MQNLQKDQLAAIIYHYVFCAEEFGSPDSDEGIQYAKAKLKEMGYPTDPVYDNDAEPRIKWASEGFDYLAFLGF